MNQFNCLLRAAMLCKIANITLSIPPFVTEDVNGNSLYLSPKIFFDIDKMFKGISHAQLKDISVISHMASPLILHGRWKNRSMLGKQALMFINSYLSTRFVDEFHNNITVYSRVREFLEVLKSTQGNYIAAGNLQHTLLGKDALPLLERIKFSTFFKRFIKAAKIQSNFTKTYTTVHWRRGDFEKACRKNKNYTKCFPSVHMINKIAKYSTVLVATNEKNQTSLKILDEMSHILQKFHFTEMDPVTSLLFDFYFMIDASQFIGNSYSTISRNVASIRQFLGKPTDFF